MERNFKTLRIAELCLHINNLTWSLNSYIYLIVPFVRPRFTWPI
jgi:hypothetical protein